MPGTRSGEDARTRNWGCCWCLSDVPASALFDDGKGDKLDFMKLGRAFLLLVLPASSREEVFRCMGISFVPRTFCALEVLFLLFSEQRSSWLSPKSWD